MYTGVACVYGVPEAVTALGGGNRPPPVIVVIPPVFGVAGGVPEAV